MRITRWGAAVLAVAMVVAGLIAGLAIGRGQSDRPVVHAQEAFQTSREMRPFREKYGPAKNTEGEEEWFIRDFFQDRRNGTFVDVGANHYQKTSKTYYLETALGWSGIAIEPQKEFADGFKKNRPRTKFLPLFVSDVSNETARLYIIKRYPVVSSSNEQFVKQFGTPDEARDVPTITLNDLLAAERMPRMDFLSIDIELNEPRALKGFDIDRFKPALVCIEGLLPVRQEILNYFTEHRYVLVGKYMWVDLENMYFAPLESLRTQQ